MQAKAPAWTFSPHQLIPAKISETSAPSKGQRFKQIRFLLGGDVVFALTKVPCLYTFSFFCHLPHDNVHHLTPVHVSGVCSLSAALKPGREKKVQSLLICPLTADSVLDPAAPD